MGIGRFCPNVLYISDKFDVSHVLHIVLHVFVHVPIPNVIVYGLYGLAYVFCHSSAQLSIFGHYTNIKKIHEVACVWRACVRNCFFFCWFASINDSTS